MFSSFLLYSSLVLLNQLFNSFLDLLVLRLKLGYFPAIVLKFRFCFLSPSIVGELKLLVLSLQRSCLSSLGLQVFVLANQLILDIFKLDGVLKYGLGIRFRAILSEIQTNFEICPVFGQTLDYSWGNLLPALPFRSHPLCICSSGTFPTADPWLQWF